jgi:diguanylate cyclase (GGDEF)-like protein/PAS domain S-box-containing protein
MRNVHQGGTPPDENARHFAVMVEKVRDYAIFLTTPERVITTWNDAARQMKGFTEAEAVGQHLRILYREEDRLAGRPEDNIRMAAEDGIYYEEFWRQRKDGSLFWAAIELIALTDPQGHLSGFGKITKDLSARKRLENELQHERDRAEITLRSIADGVISLDSDGRIELMNVQAEKLTGWCEADALGCELGEVLHVASGSSSTGDSPSELAPPADSPDAGDPTLVLESRDGTCYAIERSVTPVPSEDGRPAGAVVVFRDVTAARERLRTLAHEAAHDALTGLANRAEFERRLTRAWQRAARGSAKAALLFLDLDGFKAINGMSGHESGDRLLGEVARVYASHVRAHDTLARLGGDEFALIVDDCSRDEALAVARKLLDATRTLQFEYGGAKLTIGVSIGVAMIDPATGPIEQILHAADVACYTAKSRGRNRVQMHPLH